MSRRELDRQLDELERGMGGGGTGGDDGSTGSDSPSTGSDSLAEMRQPARFEPNSERVQSELDGLRAAIPGEPLIDYPIYSAPPQPSSRSGARAFQCQAQSCPGGYYADLDAQCQVFHVCQNDGRMDTFLCPNGTIFSQQHFVCVWWWQVDCSQAPKFYRLNDAIYCNSMTLPAAMSSIGVGVGAGDSQSASRNQADFNSMSMMMFTNRPQANANDEQLLGSTMSSGGINGGSTTTEQSSGSTAATANANRQQGGGESSTPSNSEIDLNQQQQQQLELLARRAA